MNTTVRLRGGHALHTMIPAFVPNLSENRFARNSKDGFLESSELCRTRFEILSFQTGAFRITVVHAVKIGGENRCFVSSGSSADFHDGVTLFIFIGWQQCDLNGALKIADSFFQIWDFVISHRSDLDVTRHRQLAIVIQLLAHRFEFAPLCQQLLDVRVLAHDLASALALGKKRRISDLALELFEALAFQFNKGIKVHKYLVAAIADRGSGRGPPAPATESS